MDNTFSFQLNERSISSGAYWQLAELKSDVVFTNAYISATIPAPHPASLRCIIKVNSGTTGPAGTLISELMISSSGMSTGESVNVTGYAGERVKLNWIEAVSPPIYNPHATNATVIISGHKI